MNKQGGEKREGRVNGEVRGKSFMRHGKRTEKRREGGAEVCGGSE